jgi:hypothetical protein
VCRTNYIPRGATRDFFPNLHMLAHTHTHTYTRARRSRSSYYRARSRLGKLENRQGIRTIRRHVHVQGRDLFEKRLLRRTKSRNVICISSHRAMSSVASHKSRSRLFPSPSLPRELHHHSPRKTTDTFLTAAKTRVVRRNARARMRRNVEDGSEGTHVDMKSEIIVKYVSQSCFAVKYVSQCFEKLHRASARPKALIIGCTTNLPLINRQPWLLSLHRS